jgi:hypothetical protein
MSNFVEEFIKQNERILAFLNLMRKDSENRDFNFPATENILAVTQYNAAFGVDVAILAQILDKSENYADYSFDDISRLFDSLIKLQEFNLETYLEAGHFEWTVMDNKDKAMQIANLGISKANQQINELSQLLAKIETESGSAQ